MLVKTPKISLGSWAFSFGPFEDHPWPFSEFIQYAAEAGYDGVEINGFHPHPHPDVYDTAEKCAVLKQEINDFGLGISGYAPDFHAVPPAEVPTEKYLAAIDKSLAFCNHMGIDVLRVDTVSPPDALPPDAYRRRFDHLAETWHAAAAACQKAGVLLVWEFEPGFWLNKPSEVKNAVEAVNHSHFKLLFDTSHAYMGSVIGARQTGEKETLKGGVIEYAQLVADHIGHFHLIDSDGTLHHEETSTHAPFGEGYIDFKAVLSAMKPVIEPLEWWCVDFCFCPTTEVDGRKAVPFLKKLIAELD
jgi:sugar phosphate isomerase/epimerase